MEAKLVMCITGLSCTGKTTYAERLPFPVLFIGKALREKYGEDYFTGQENPGAPAEMHDEILQMVKGFLIENAHEPIIAFESTPRTPEQVDFLDVAYSDFQRVPFVVNFEASSRDRIERAGVRDETESQKQLTLARFAADNFEETLDEVMASYPIIDINTSK